MLLAKRTAGAATALCSIAVAMEVMVAVESNE